MPNDYNKIASIYDFLKKLVFGKSLIKAECHFLKNINKSSTLLVIGSGSSEFLEYLTHDSFEKIHCIDKSREMCRRTHKRLKKHRTNPSFEVFCENFSEVTLSLQYDIVAMPFFLDCLNDEEIETALNKAHLWLKNGGVLIITDFNDKSKGILKRSLIKLMYAFFRLSTNISRADLPEYKSFIDEKKFLIEKVHPSPSGLILSMKLKKISV